MKMKQRPQHAIERTVRHQHRDEVTVYTAYPKKLADANGIEYRYWKEVSFEPSMGVLDTPILVLSDDGIVFPVYSVHSVKGRFLLRSAFGSFMIPSYKIYDKIRINVLSDSDVSSADFVSRCRHTKDGLRNTITTLASHGLCREEIVSLIATENTSAKARLVRNIYSQEETQKMIRQEVKELLTRCGISEEAVVQMLMDAHDIAKEKRDVANMLRSCENLIDMYGLKDRAKETVTNTLAIESEVDDLERLESVKERLKLTQKTEREGE